ncbi:hypothetical protein L6R52_24450 [Myxococcota bacterium]|nr:hypothetical protein [Myxococcota bacterium]
MARTLRSAPLALLCLAIACSSDPPAGPGAPDAGPIADTGPADTGVVTDADMDGLPDDWERDQGLDPARDDAAEDPDGDGLTNAVELAGGTRARDVDSDDDGVGDGEEDANQNGVADAGETSATNADSDGDGLSDGQELGRTTPLTSARPGIAGTDPAVFRADADPASTTSPTSADTDGDGIPDGVEDRNRDGRWDAGETGALDLDSDDDGIADGVEDVNANGTIDAGETSPIAADSDGDGIPDGVEKGVTMPVVDPDGNGPLGGTLVATWRPDEDPSTTTSPTNPDSDGDGVLDGDEDWNRNGRYEPPRELDPLAADSDADGVPDAGEGIAVVCGAAALRPIALHSLAGADITLGLPLDYAEISVLRDTSGRGVGLMFRNASTGVVGFAVSRAPMAGDVSGEQRDVRTRIDNAAGLSTEQDRALITWDGFPAIFSTARATSGGDTVDVAADMARRVAQAGALTGALPPAGASPGAFTVYYETILRTGPGGAPLRAVVIGAIAAAPTSDATLIQLSDVANGTGIAQFGDFTGTGCDQFTSAPGNDVLDLLWIVDNSCSMSDEQNNVAAAGTEMVALLSTTQLSWRLALTTTEQNGGNLVRGFTASTPRATAEAESAAWATAVGQLGTGGSGEERGATIGITAAQNALPATAAESPSRFRQGASVIIVHMSDEEDFSVKLASGGGDTQCPENGGKQTRIDELINGYLGLATDPTIAGLTTFAIHGTQPNTTGADFCSFDQGAADCTGASQHGRSYVDIANAMGGGTGSICGNMSQVVQDIVRAGAGIASQIELTEAPISSTIRVVMADESGSFLGRPDIPRSRQDGFDYAFSLDVASNRVEHKIVFYGSARPPANRQLMISYRTWEQGSPSPGGPDCDCGAGQRCNADTNACEIDPTCGGGCEAPDVCNMSTGMCEPPDPCQGMCGENEQCLPDTGMCVPITDPCAECGPGEICDTSVDPPVCRGV